MKELLTTIIKPPVWFRWLFGLASLIGVFAVLKYGQRDTVYAYVLYPASALGLVYLISVTVVPLAQKIWDRLMEIPLFRRYVKDPDFGARMRLYLSTLAHASVAVFKLIAGIWFNSVWFIVVGIYYGFLVLLRLALVVWDRKTAGLDEDAADRARWISYRRTGWMMFLLILGLSGITVVTVRFNQGDTYPGFLILAVAAYSFYRIGIAIGRIVSRNQSSDPVFRAARAIDFCFAVMAMFSLQTSMIATFHTGPGADLANMAGGTTAALVNVVISAVMIWRSSRHLKSTALKS